MFKVKCYNGIMATRRVNLYRYVLNEYILESDLMKLNEMAQISLCSQNVSTSSSRHRNTGQSQRICILCDEIRAQNVFHAIGQCPKFNDLKT